MTDSPANAVLEFLGMWLSDREKGIERDLAAYQALFPGHETAIEAEWRAATDPNADAQVGPAGSDANGRIGRFRLVRELGRGGQGRVWLAEDEELGRPVALKLVPRSPLTEDLAPRLRREARTMSRLSHPGLCPVYDAGVEGPYGWIALRYVEGRTLAARIHAERAGTAARTTVEHVLREGEALARALHVAHSAGIVHRDVKPGNVMLGLDGAPVLLDFGIALDDAPQAELTRTGEALGTPAYMAPERLEGRARADARSDVWSLGVTLFEALTLARPFAAPTHVAEARAVLEQEAPDPRELRREVPRDVALLLATALARRPEDRYATAADFAEDLRRARVHEPLRARPTGTFARLGRWCQRRPAFATSLGALALALVGGTTISTALWLRTRDALLVSDGLYRDIGQLADSLEARRLLAGVDALWPALDSRASGFERWLADAERLEAREGEYTAVLATARARVASGAARPTDAWLVEGLEELLARLGEVRDRRPRVAAALAFARDVRQRSIGDARELWERASERVASDARFAGFLLEPQLGLLPLGADPDSRLEEFAHLASGVAPARDAASARLVVDPETCVVLVLVPGGVTRIGVRPPDAEHLEGDAHVDSLAGPWDGPVVELRLDPYFIGKYELTQRQWERHAGANPSAYGPGSNDVRVEDAGRHPVEQASWDECDALLRALDLELPTEARWEHATRAGTGGPWWAGPTRADLAGGANLADRFAEATGKTHSWSFEPGFDDGYLVHAPVGVLRANAFGLHDVAGNVAEWCADGYEDWAAVPPRDGDGRALGGERTRPFRGGDFTNDATRARSSARDGYDRNVRISYIGVRPARAVRSGQR
ncbi:MAG: SUMF1/EgtB/PvdO family nonheme iron enzyme [Planctomycetes bacterium]|nr:SUMF1/EgtB/PvdO family nonheme iron enzyme [Planctomycetota bacterium]